MTNALNNNLHAYIISYTQLQLLVYVLFTIELKNIFLLL